MDLEVKHILKDVGELDLLWGMIEAAAMVLRFFRSRAGRLLKRLRVGRPLRHGELCSLAQQPSSLEVLHVQSRINGHLAISTRCSTAKVHLEIERAKRLYLPRWSSLPD
jgi:hypothetical protein